MTSELKGLKACFHAYGIKTALSLIIIIVDHLVCRDHGV